MISIRRIQILLMALGIFFVTGSYGSIWLSDEFDEWRRILNIVSIPLTILFLIHAPYKINFYQEEKNLFFLFILILFSTHVWGNILLINAFSKDEHTIINIVEQTDEKKFTYQMAYKRGGLGLLYRPRW